MQIKLKDGTKATVITERNDELVPYCNASNQAATEGKYDLYTNLQTGEVFAYTDEAQE